MRGGPEPQKSTEHQDLRRPQGVRCWEGGAGLPGRIGVSRPMRGGASGCRPLQAAG